MKIRISPLPVPFFAQQHLDSVKELLEGAEIEKYIRRRMDRQLEKSGIRELLEYIQECMSQAKKRPGSGAAALPL